MTRHSRLALTLILTLCAALIATSAPAPAQQADGMLASTEVERRISLAEAFFIQKNPRTGRIEWFGTAITWGLLGLSATSIALMWLFARENQRDAIMVSDEVRHVRWMLQDDDRAGVSRRLESSPTYFAGIMRPALRESDCGYDAMLRALEQAVEEQVTTRLRRVETLNIIGSVSPMIGLFGTVYGMILAFREIVAAGGSPDPVGLAAGIGTALTTTFWGLVVAIPALSGYALLRNTIDARTSRANLAAEDLVNHFRPVAEADRD